ncbi:MAG: phenylacetate--CoA ligase family protein [Pirellula sp.]|nr:phenylacetate--CoA ligase family protein [Planctomycetota bacterium]
MDNDQAKIHAQQQDRARWKTASRSELEAWQLGRLNALLSGVLAQNAFYRERYRTDRIELRGLDGLQQLPLMNKSDWISDDAAGVAKHHSYEFDRYRRYHRTSGTRGRPMVILDTQTDWQWWIDVWQYVLDACQITSEDRVLMAFSFGPFIGFWSAHDACLHRNCMVIPSGGMSSEARIDLIHASKPTVLFSTPSYAIHLGQLAKAMGKSLSKGSVRCVFVAGEPGGSVASVREAIEELYGAKVMDHAGATEIGPWGYGSIDGRALHVIETEFIAEFIPIDKSTSPSIDEDVKELVLTSLGRIGAPVIRYRTGDLVKPSWAGDSKQQQLWGGPFVRLEQGILGRLDGMIVVRGVNIFPTSIEAIVREYPSIGEYRLVLSKPAALDELLLEIEDSDHSQESLSKELLSRLQLRVRVQRVAQGSLPRVEGKSRRVLDLR